METTCVLMALHHTINRIPDIQWESKAFFQACLEGAEVIFENDNAQPNQETQTTTNNTAMAKPKRIPKSDIKEYNLDTDEGVLFLLEDMDADPQINASKSGIYCNGSFFGAFFI